MEGAKDEEEGDHRTSRGVRIFITDTKNTDQVTRSHFTVQVAGRKFIVIIFL